MRIHPLSSELRLGLDRDLCLRRSSTGQLRSRTLNRMRLIQVRLYCKGRAAGLFADDFVVL